MCKIDKCFRKNVKSNILRKKLRILFGLEKGVLTEEEKTQLFKDINDMLKQHAKNEIKKYTTSILVRLN